MAVEYEPGLHTLYADDSDLSSSKVEVDIVAIHGLNFKNNPNHARATWSSRGSLWIRDFLPSGLQRPSRVMLYAYNSSPAMGAAAMMLDDHAKLLLQHLKAKREEVPRRPLVFICHSLGGLVVKSALVEGTLNPAYKAIVKSTRLLVFFATPHRGGNYSGIGDVAAKMVRAGLGTPSNDLLDALKASSHDAVRRFEQASHLTERCLVVSFYETENYGKLGIIVDEESAVLNLPEDREKIVRMEANHSSICKFPTAESCKPILEIISTELERAIELERRLKPRANVHWLVTRSINPLFVGRDEINRKIIDAITTVTDGVSIHQKRFILTGMGGQGKSELCLNIVNQVRNLFWGVFWVDVSTKATATAGFTRIARTLGSKVQEIDDALLLLANCQPQNNWLLVLDNADDPETYYGDYFPSGTRGTVLMTSRLPECRLHGTVGAQELGSLSEEECISLLLDSIGIAEEAKLESRSAAGVIASELGYHTLALLHAGAYISSGHCTMAEYPAEYRRQQKRLLNFNLSQSQSRYRSVYATFEASAQVLESSEAECAQNALTLLGLLSTLHYEDIPLEIFQYSWDGAKLAQKNHDNDETINHLSQWHVSQLPEFMGARDISWNEDRLSSAVNQLSSLGLVNISSIRDMTMLSLHPLTHGWVAARQDEAQRQAYRNSSACTVALYGYLGSRHLRLFGRIGTHVMSIVRSQGFMDHVKLSRHMIQVLVQLCDMLHGVHYDQEVASILAQLFQFLGADPESPSEKLLPLYQLLWAHQYRIGNTKESIKTIENVLAIQQSTLGEHHLEVLTTQYELGRAYLTNGQRLDAIAILEEVRYKQEHHLKLDRDHPAQLELHEHLGSAYSSNGQTKEAMSILEELVSIRKSKYQNGDTSLFASQYQLGMAYLANCQTKDAINLFEEANMAQAEYVEDNHPNRIVIQSGLGRAYLLNGQIEKAIEFFEKASRVYSTRVDWNQARLSVEHELGTAYRMNGRTEEAITIFETILRVSPLDEDHPGTLAIQYELAIAYLQNGQTRAAIDMFEMIRAIQETSLDNKTDEYMTIVELSSAYVADGQIKKGIKVLEDVIRSRKLILDENHPSILGMQLRLGSAYLNDGRTKDAVHVLEKVVQAHSSTLEENHHERLGSQHALAKAYLDNGQIKDAIRIYEKVVEGKRANHHPEHPSLLASIHELARVYLMHGEVKRGIEVCEEVVTIQESVLDESHPDQIGSLLLLGSSYLEDNQTARGIALLEKVDKLVRTRFDETHPDRLQSHGKLGSAYLKAGQIEKALVILKEAVETGKTSFEEDHPTKLSIQHHLGSAYLANGQVDEAIKLLQEIVKTRESSNFPENHPSRLMSLQKLGSAYMINGRTEEAVVILEDVDRIRADLDESHPSRLGSQHDLACCYLSLDRIDDAIRVFEEVVRIEAVAIARNHPSRLKSLGQLGSAYLRKGNKKKAIKTLEEVVSIGNESLEKTDRLHLGSELWLGLAYLNNGQDKKAISMFEEMLGTVKQCVSENDVLRLRTQYELGCAYVNRGQTKQAILHLEELADILTGHRGGQFPPYPTLKEVRRELSRAYKQKKLPYRILSTFGMGSSIGPDVPDENYEL